MLTQINDLPSHVVGFSASGKVDKHDYDTVLIPAVNKLADKTGAINYLFILNTDISNFTMGAITDDLKIGLKQFFRWHKIAIVSDQEGVNKFTDMIGTVIHGEVKSYTKSQLSEARAWVAA